MTHLFKLIILGSFIFNGVSVVARPSSSRNFDRKQTGIKLETPKSFQGETSGVPKTPWNSNSIAGERILMNLNQSQKRLNFEDLVHFQSGVFEINNDGTNVLSKCIYSAGEWTRVNYLYQDCEIDPATGEPAIEDQLKTESVPNDEPFFLFRHLGIDVSPSTNYNEWYKTVESIDLNNHYGDLKRTVGIAVSNDELAWSMDTRNLPERMRLEIPGAGIHTHIGESFSANGYYIFTSKESRLRVSLNMHVSRYILQGIGKANLTIGSTFHVPDVNGEPIPLTLNVSLVSLPGINLTEGISSDSRSLFAHTNLSSDATFIKHIQGGKLSGPTSSYKDFEFEITYNELMNLIKTMSDARQSQKLSKLSTDISQIRFRGVNLKNEYTHLETIKDNAITTFKVRSFTASVINP